MRAMGSSYDQWPTLSNLSKTTSADAETALCVAQPRSRPLEAVGKRACLILSPAEDVLERALRPFIMAKQAIPLIFDPNFMLRPLRRSPKKVSFTNIIY